MRIPVVLLAVPALFAQSPAPVFTREGLVPLLANHAKLLAPGMVVELYGQHLAPAPFCGENATPPAPYPTAICGVTVKVGAAPAGLMHVSAGQINFKIPADAPQDGTAPIQVCVRGACSAPVVMRFSAHKAFLRLRGTASVHMPVWVEIDEPGAHDVRYPCADTPWSFDGYRFEVRRNGQPLSPLPLPKTGAGGAVCRSAAQLAPLPLHLLYSFDQPGVYSVRFTETERGATLSQSDWTDISVGPYSAAGRDDWLRSMAEKAKSAPPEALVADVIPSLLAWPEEKALAVLLPLAALPDAKGSPGRFARNGLAAFGDDLLRRILPPDRLLNLCPPDGRCGAAN